jgi:hypothetical protein
MKSQVGNHAKGELAMFATIARFCVTRRRWVLAAWVLLLVIGLAAVIPLFGKLKNSASATGSESARGAATRAPRRRRPAASGRRRPVFEERRERGGRGQVVQDLEAQAIGGEEDGVRLGRRVTLIRSSPSTSEPVRNAVSFTYSARGAGVRV